MAREINLVPDIKNEMIRTLKLRNFIFFLCIVVAAASVGITLVFGLIAGGQQLAIDNKQSTIDKMSNKLASFKDLGEFLTIKDQLGHISSLTSDKKVFSRTFDTLLALIPTGADSIVISELNVDLASETPTFSFEAQANAGQEPFIDYNVLDSFKKSMQYMRYDYGQYVDKNGNTIPAYCIIDKNEDGVFFGENDKNLYAYWTIDAKGCNPSTNSSDESTSDASSTESNSSSYATEDYNGQKVVKIWRTPQFNEWYKTTPVEGQPYMDLEGKISGVEHFESSCISYEGDASQSTSSPKWTKKDDTCHLVPEDSEGITITDSSNGRDSSGELVLRFSATLAVAPEAFQFENTHMRIIPPSGRRNVTDSYVQVQTMFGERASDCKEGDTTCKNNAANRGEN